jgi:hypothetical protein
VAGGAILVEAPHDAASAINRQLGAAGLYPAELTPRRESLEAVFRELTSDHDDPTGSPDAGTDRAPDASRTDDSGGTGGAGGAGGASGTGGAATGAEAAR